MYFLETAKNNASHSRAFSWSLVLSVLVSFVLGLSLSGVGWCGILVSFPSSPCLRLRLSSFQGREPIQKWNLRIVCFRSPELMSEVLFIFWLFIFFGLHLYIPLCFYQGDFLLKLYNIRYIFPFYWIILCINIQCQYNRVDITTW